MRSTLCDQWGVTCPQSCPTCDENNLEAVAAIETGCGNTELGDDTVAILWTGHTYLQCGDRVYIHGLEPEGDLAGSIKRVTDTGDLPQGERQCDNYNSSNHSCTDWADLGDFITIKLIDD